MATWRPSGRLVDAPWPAVLITLARSADGVSLQLGLRPGAAPERRSRRGDLRSVRPRRLPIASPVTATTTSSLPTATGASPGRWWSTDRCRSGSTRSLRATHDLDVPQLRPGVGAPGAAVVSDHPTPAGHLRRSTPRSTIDRTRMTATALHAASEGALEGDRLLLPTDPPRVGPESRRLLLRLAIVLGTLQLLAAVLVFVVGGHTARTIGLSIVCARRRPPVRRLARPVRRRRARRGRGAGAVVGRQRALRDPARVGGGRPRCGGARRRAPPVRRRRHALDVGDSGRLRPRCADRRVHGLACRARLPSQEGQDPRAERVPAHRRAARAPHQPSRARRHRRRTAGVVLRLRVPARRRPRRPRLGRAVPRRHAAALPVEQPVVGDEPVRREHAAERAAPHRARAHQHGAQAHRPACVALLAHA